MSYEGFGNQPPEQQPQGPGQQPWQQSQPPQPGGQSYPPQGGQPQQPPGQPGSAPPWPSAPQVGQPSYPGQQPYPGQQQPYPEQQPSHEQPPSSGQPWPGATGGAPPYPAEQPQWGAYPAAPAFGADPGFGVPPQPKKKKTGLIVGIIAAVVLLVGLGIGGALFLTKDDKDKKDDKSSSQEAKVGTPAALMAKIRAASICDMHDLEALKKYAPNTGYGGADHNFYSCTGLAGTEIPGSDGKLKLDADRYLFELTVGRKYDQEDQAEDTPEQVDGQQIFLDSTSKDMSKPDDTCYYNLAFKGVGFGAQLRARKLIPGATTDGNWPERCTVAKEYLAKIAPKILALKERSKPPTEPTVLGKDPCAKREEIIAAVGLSGWTPGETTYQNPYACEIPFTKQGEAYTQQVSVYWDLDAVPSTTTLGGGQRAENMQLGGLNGVRFSSESSGTSIATGQPYKAGGSCQNTMVLKPEDPGVANSATLLRIELSTAPARGSASQPGQTVDVPAPSCAPVDQATEKVIAGVQGQ